LDSKSLEFNQLRKQFLELRLIRNTWKKELLEDSGKSIEDFRKEIYKKFNIKDEPTDLDLLLKLQTSESILGSRTHSNDLVTTSKDNPSTLLIYLIIIKSRYRIKLVEVTL